MFPVYKNHDDKLAAVSRTTSQLTEPDENPP